MDRKALASLGGIAKVVLRVSTIDPRVDIPIGRAAVALTALVDLGVSEITLVVASLTAPIIPKVGKM